MDKRQDGVNFDGKPAIGRRHEDAATGNPPEFPQEGALISMRADMLDDGT